MSKSENWTKKIEEFSLQLNSPILSIPGISHFSGTSILAELGGLHNYSTASQIIKFAGVSPYKHKSSQYEAQQYGHHQERIALFKENTLPGYPSGYKAQSRVPCLLSS